MYAEIKSNNKILVNRLDDSERILLKDICDRANDADKEAVMSPIIDECGDFGGVFIEIKDKENPEPSEEAPEEDLEET